MLQEISSADQLDLAAWKDENDSKEKTVAII